MAAALLDLLDDAAVMTAEEYEEEVSGEDADELDDEIDEKFDTELGKAASLGGDGKEEVETPVPL